MATLRENSKTHYDGNGSLEHINAGSLQRIADAAEVMAKNHAQLIAERDRFEGYYRDERKRRERLERSNNALRGHINRMKREAGKAGA